MVDDSQVHTPPVEPAAPAPQDSAPLIDPREFEILQREVSDAREAFGTLQPHSERIKRLLEDPSAGQLFDNAVEAYERAKRQNGPQFDEAGRAIYDKVSRLEKFVDDVEKQRKDEAERPQREFQQHYNEWANSTVNNRFFSRLMADHPELKPRDMQYLAQVAAESNFEPLESVWKKESWRFERATTATPPPSLRADAGDGTAAGAATGTDGVSMRDRIIQLERSRLGITR